MQNLVEIEQTEEEAEFAESFAIGTDHLERNAHRYGIALGLLIALVVALAIL